MYVKSINWLCFSLKNVNDNYPCKELIEKKVSLLTPKQMLHLIISYHYS